MHLWCTVAMESAYADLWAVTEHTQEIAIPVATIPNTNDTCFWGTRCDLESLRVASLSMDDSRMWSIGDISGQLQAAADSCQLLERGVASKDFGVSACRPRSHISVWRYATWKWFYDLHIQRYDAQNTCWQRYSFSRLCSDRECCPKHQP